jgi:hypothetical protein
VKFNVKVLELPLSGVYEHVAVNVEPEPVADFVPQPEISDPPTMNANVPAMFETAVRVDAEFTVNAGTVKLEIVGAIFAAVVKLTAIEALEFPTAL